MLHCPVTVSSPSAPQSGKGAATLVGAAVLAPVGDAAILARPLLIQAAARWRWGWFRKLVCHTKGGQCGIGLRDVIVPLPRSVHLKRSAAQVGPAKIYRYGRADGLESNSAIPHLDRRAILKVELDAGGGVVIDTSYSHVPAQAPSLRLLMRDGSLQGEGEGRMRARVRGEVRV